MALCDGFMDTSSLTKKKALSLIEEHKEQIKALGVKRLGLFGSFVRGELCGESDIDLLVEFEKDEKAFDNFIQLSFFLEDLLNRHVELLTTESLSPYIGPHIMSEVEYVIGEIDRVVAEVQEALTDETRLADLKSRLKYGFLMGLETPDEVASALARVISATGGIEAIDELYVAYEAVTPENVRAAAKSYLDSKRRTVAVLRGTK